VNPTDRDRLKTTFNEVAELYDRVRPHYPDELFDDIIHLGALQPGASVLEIGCGAGRATLPLARRGFRITCVELGEDLAAVARRNLASFPSVKIITSPFETWDPNSVAQGPSPEPLVGPPFDLVLAATCWDWIDPAVGYVKAAAMLKSHGALAIAATGHAFPADADPFFHEIQDAYEAIGDPRIDWPQPLPEDVPDMRDEIEASGLFGDVQVRRYVWELMYTADQYVDLLNTFSGHIAMDPDKRDYLSGRVRELINARPDPRIRRHWLTILTVARKL
jgi:SAM-dependent methyltransferase